MVGVVSSSAFTCPSNTLNIPPEWVWDGMGTCSRHTHTHVPVCMKSTLFPLNLSDCVCRSESMPCTVLAMYVQSVSIPVAAHTASTRSGGGEGGKEEQRAFVTETIRVIASEASLLR